MTLTKAVLAENLNYNVGLSKKESKEFVESFFSTMREHLESGQELKLSGFGNFSIRDKKPRPGRNPKTLESVEISARRVVTFLPGQKLRGRIINEYETINAKRSS
ncbi:integration host factor subunit alpha [Shewanella sp. KX20019]|uniref:integration host factor subunit alpha n=1 Tax=Shewanella sp. KX20019 TaxID=2803864 RepID=UPI001926D6A2|nr:integration host factor subunit alpha [Shewanella sp. KX20019]QQX80811.1 integration host factor subunit alpha [Shewanella sp. KX20019]